MRAEQARDVARYNRWMNARLYALCADLTDNERRHDRGAFFKSIHRTLNHLLLADKVWMGRFSGESFTAASLDQEIYHDFAELNRVRVATDEDIIHWVDNLTEEILSGQFSYTSMVTPQQRQCEYWLVVAHFFSHPTHHRGQLTTLLGQCGKDCGTTDLMWLPQVVERNSVL